MESLRDGNLNFDNDYMYNVTICRCLVFKTLCQLSLFRSFVFGNKLSSDNIARTLHAYFAIIVAIVKIYFVLKFSNILKILNGFGKLNKFKSCFREF